MQLEDINIKFDEKSEKPDNENPAIHHINAVNLEKIEICPACGYLVVPKTKNYRTIFHYCEGPDGVKRIYRINLCSQRYKCTNPKRIHSSTAGMLDHKSPYTPEFMEHVITLFLQKEKYSYSEIARKVGLTQPSVSKIVKGFTKDLAFRYNPVKDFSSYYFHRFRYQGKYCYYLTRFDFCQKPVLLSFFGSKDTWAEIEEYLELYWKDIDSSVTFYTDNDKRLEISIQKHIKKPIILVSRYACEQRIERFLQDYEGEEYHDLLRKELNYYLAILGSPEYEQLLELWYGSFEIKENGLRSALEAFRQSLMYDPIMYFSFQMFPPEHKKINSLINQYNVQHLPFDMMVLRMMYHFYEDRIFAPDVSDPEEKLQEKELKEHGFISGDSFPLLDFPDVSF